MAASFSWVESGGSTCSHQPRVVRKAFGDGYQARIPHGINVDPRSWALRFDRIDVLVADEIMAFLSANAATSFDWQQPPEGGVDGVVIRVECTQWARTYETDLTCTITATFEQRFEP